VAPPGKEDLITQGRKLLEERCFFEKDFTLVFSNTGLAEWIGSKDPEWWLRYCRLRAGTGKSESTSFEFGEQIRGIDARLQVSRAYRGEAWTVSIRWDPKPGGPSKPQRLPDETTPWAADPRYGFAEEKQEDPFLFSISEVVDCLWELIVAGNDKLEPGLVFVTGPTNSSKSKIARGLVWKHLRAKKGRRHLVTFEDPIEEFVFGNSWDPSNLKLVGDVLPPFDYTPRQKPTDCKDLKEAIKGALRQTPTAFYIGEMREQEDIRTAVDFGGTGHLVVATGHAGSLVESAEKIFRAVGARDPGRRALYVGKILAIIHLHLIQQVLRIDGQDHTLSALVPTLYRKTTLGIQGLVADGLFSLIPYYSENDDELRQTGCLGRQYLARKLGSIRAIPEGSAPPPGPKKVLHEEWDELRKWNCDREAKPPRSVETSAGVRLIDKALWEDIHGR